MKAQIQRHQIHVRPVHFDDQAVLGSSDSFISKETIKGAKQLYLQHDKLEKTYNY